MRHWVFDLDGTLVDSFSQYFAALEEIFRKHGEHFDEGLRQPALTEPLDVFFSRHLGASSLPRAFALLQALSNEGAEAILPFRGMPQVVSRLSARGDRVAVWTNRDLESATLILKHSGLGPLAEACVSGTCVKRRKPHPEGLSRLIERFGCDPASVTMVGDHEHDIAAARALGVRSVRASWHSYWPQADCGADLEFSSVEDFGAWAGVSGALG